jgi:hypothetical protein
VGLEHTVIDEQDCPPLDPWAGLVLGVSTGSGITWDTVARSIYARLGIWDPSLQVSFWPTEVRTPTQPFATDQLSITGGSLGT